MAQDGTRRRSSGKQQHPRQSHSFASGSVSLSRAKTTPNSRTQPNRPRRRAHKAPKRLQPMSSSQQARTSHRPQQMSQERTKQPQQMPTPANRWKPWALLLLPSPSFLMLLSQHLRRRKRQRIRQQPAQQKPPPNLRQKQSENRSARRPPLSFASR